MASKSDSTEDLFYEDSYLPTPEYNVAPVCIQPEPTTAWDSENIKSPSRLLMLRPHEVRPYLGHHDRAEDTTPLLQPPPAFDGGRTAFEASHHESRSDSMCSDTSYKFDVILASLQNLALELEKDFEQGEEFFSRGQTTRMHPHEPSRLKESISDHKPPVY